MTQRKSPLASPSPASNRRSESPAEKAALVLACVHRDDPGLAASLLEKLDKTSLTRVLKEMSRLGAVDAARGEQALHDFLEILGPRAAGMAQASSPHLASLSMHRAREALLGTLKERLGPDDPFWSEHAADATVSRIQTLIGAMPERSLLDFIRGEHPQVATLTLALAPSRSGAKALKHLPSDVATELMLRLASLDEVAAEVLEELAEALDEFSKRLTERRSLLPEGGAKKLASLLEDVEAPFREKLLGALESHANPGAATLSSDIRRELLTFEKLARLLPRDLGRVIGSMAEDALALALFGEPETVRDSFFAALSSRRRSAIEDASHLLSEESLRLPAKRALKSQAQKDLIARATALYAEGEILFPWEDSLVS